MGTQKPGMALFVAVNRKEYVLCVTFGFIPSRNDWHKMFAVTGIYKIVLSRFNIKWAVLPSEYYNC